MLVRDVFQWLNDSRLGSSLRESSLMFPLVETAHLLTIALLVGTILVFDLRLTGLLFRREAVSAMARQLLPLTWAGFALTAFTGLLLLIAEAERMYTNPAFWWKAGLLALVGLNALAFHLTVFRRVDDWNETDDIPMRARLAGALSMTFWSGVIIAGRVIAYY